VILRTLLLLSLLASTTSLPADTCTAYPEGSWKLDKDSALTFELKWLDALNNKDSAALNCILAPEFIDTSRTGALRPKEQILGELASRQDQYHQTLTGLNAKLFGETAIVRGMNVITDSKGTEVLRIRFTDVLHFKDGRWLAVAAQETDAH